MILQTSFARETGLPRWGCMILSLLWIVLRAPGRELDAALVLRVLEDALTRPAPWSPGKTVITDAGETGNWQLFLWDPTELVKIALGYVGTAWCGDQYPDQRTVHPSKADVMRVRHPDVVAAQPRDYVGLVGTLVQFERPNPDGHWVACDPAGLSVLYDPDPSLGIDGWRRTGQWRGVRVWKGC